MQKTCSRGHIFEKKSATPMCPVCWPGRYRKTALKTQHNFRARVWVYPAAQAAWHFLTVPKKLSASIKKEFGSKAKGWGSIPVEVTIGKTHWKTSIFPDRNINAYILPLKAEVRKREGIGKADTILVSIKITARNQ